MRPMRAKLCVANEKDLQSLSSSGWVLVRTVESYDCITVIRSELDTTKTDRQYGQVPVVTLHNQECVRQTKYLMYLDEHSTLADLAEKNRDLVERNGQLALEVDAAKQALHISNGQLGEAKDKAGRVHDNYVHLEKRLQQEKDRAYKFEDDMVKANNQRDKLIAAVGKLKAKEILGE